MRAPVAVLLLLVPLALPTGGAAEGPDCAAGGGDAGDSAATATRLASAAFNCGGRVTPSDDDWYVVRFEAGSVAHIDVGDTAVTEAFVYDHAGALVATNPHSATGHPVAATGDWTIHVRQDAELQSAGTTYLLGFWSRELHGAGQHEIPNPLGAANPARGVTRLLGPDAADGVDGKWIALPFTTHGGERIALDFSTAAHFYAADGAEVGSVALCPNACAVPAGADSMLLTSGRASADETQRARYEYWLRY